MSKPDLTEMSLTFTQDEDGSSSRVGESIQQLDVELICNDTMKEGCYFAIKTERWAFDDPEEFVAILKRCLDTAKTGT